MTVVNYLTKTELPNALNTGNLDASSQQAIINQLIADGLYTNSSHDGKSVWVESDIYKGVAQHPLFDSAGNPAVPAFVQVLEVEGTNVTVQTDAALKIIVDDGNGAHNTLNVTGGNSPEYIVLGNSNTTVNLTDTGNDTVLGGDGNDSITANSGKDVLYGGGGADTLHGGSGADSLYGGSGNDVLIAGTGHHQYLSAGGGSDQLTDLLSTGTDTLVAGSGSDTITGVQGDAFLLPTSGSAGGKDVYDIYNGTGNSTINLGSGHDTVNFFTTAGNDTISNGGGVDTVNFKGSSTDYLTDIKSITPGTGAQSGDYLIKFTDGQSVDLIGHSESASKTAFTLDFKDGTLNLKGGS
jgi:Ca2+-binding RTX toxin-like protein